MNINIKSIKIKDVLNNPDKYNVNNLSKIMPSDYNTVLNNTKHWIDLFHKDKDKYKLICINDKYTINWIKEASNIGKITGRFSKIYQEDLENLNKNFDKGYFIRTEHNSLKEGIHGYGPYYNLKNVIESICTCSNTHVGIHENDICINIYLMEWKKIDKNKEFRIFVYNNNITAISIQFIYTVNTWILNKTTNEIKDLVINIDKFFKKNIKEKLINKIKYTFDLVLLENNEFYFIEPNSFGKDYSAGSSLFHWINDENILLNDSTNQIEFRYTI